MLVTNYEEHQQAAMEAGCVRGFGKLAVNEPETREAWNRTSEQEKSSLRTIRTSIGQVVQAWRGHAADLIRTVRNPSVLNSPTLGDGVQPTVAYESRARIRNRIDRRRHRSCRRLACWGPSQASTANLGETWSIRCKHR